MRTQENLIVYYNEMQTECHRNMKFTEIFDALDKVRLLWLTQLLLFITVTGWVRIIKKGQLGVMILPLRPQYVKPIE